MAGGHWTLDRMNAIPPARMRHAPPYVHGIRRRRFRGTGRAGRQARGRLVLCDAVRRCERRAESVQGHYN